MGASSPTERFAAARAVADAVLFEGYVLYPYRASATKNQLRWQFGVVAPRPFAEADGSERWQVRTECLVDPGRDPVLAVRLRFLHVQQRRQQGETWDEAELREVDVDAIALLPPEGVRREVPFHLDDGEDVDVGDTGLVVRRREPLDGVLGVEATWAIGPAPLVKVAVTVANTSPWDQPGAPRHDAMRRSLVGLHTLLAVDDGLLLSLLDPPERARAAARSCRNDGTYPVLVATAGAGDVVLSSPIILYDHPTIAPESEGDLFDATEIDEILALRVLTLTDAEKAEAGRTDARAASIVARVEAMTPEAFARLHGEVRPIDPDPHLHRGPERHRVTDGDQVPWWDPAVDEAYDPTTDSLLIGDTLVARGTAVRLRPNRRADAHDMFLAGMDATVTGVFTDAEGEVMVAVTVDDDPAGEVLSWQRRGLFFHADELEVRL